eukprot:3556144-Amphidinium_carterae.1
MDGVILPKASFANSAGLGSGGCARSDATAAWAAFQITTVALHIINLRAMQPCSRSLATKQWEDGTL